MPRLPVCPPDSLLCGTYRVIDVRHLRHLTAVGGSCIGDDRPNGAQAPVIGISPDSGWWKITVNPANIPAGNAWMSAEYVTAQNTENVPVVQPPPLPLEAELPAPGPDDPQATAIEPINVRSGPRTVYESYGVAPIGTTGRVMGISQDGSWWVVALPTDVASDGMGWVNAAYVSTANTEGVPVVETPPLP